MDEKTGQEEQTWCSQNDLGGSRGGVKIYKTKITSGLLSDSEEKCPTWQSTPGLSRVIKNSFQFSSIPEENLVTLG